MKILLVAPMPPQAQAPGAIPLVLHAQLTGLVARHEVTLVTVAGPDVAELGAVEKLRAQGIEVEAVMRSEPSALLRWERRWRLASTWLQGYYPWRTIWYWEPRMQPILDRLLTQRHFDVLQLEDNALGIYRYPTRVPIVMTEHEVRRPRPIDWRNRGSRHRLRSLLSEADWCRWPRYERQLWSRFDRVQVFTTRDAASIQSIAPELSSRVRVNPFAVDLPAEANPIHEVQGNLLFVGNYTHPPNVDAALWLGRQIMPLLRSRYPGICLTLVGMYPPDSVRALACDDIIVTGAVPEIEPFLERAAVVLAPIRIGGGMRMKVLYAMAMGKAVVTTSRGAAGLAMGTDQPPLVIADDHEDIVEGIVAMLQADQQRRELGRRARAFVVQHYSPPAYARRQEAIYDELLTERAAQ